MKRFFNLMLGIALVLCSAVASAEEAETWIRAGKVFDGVAFLENRFIVVRGETIAALVDGMERPPAGASIVDASEMTVIPGFVEGHSHFFGFPMPMASRPETNAGKMAEQGFSKAPDNRLALFRSGITTVVDMGSPLEGYLDMRRQVEKGTLLCPELYFPGPLFTAPGGHPAGTIYKGTHFLIDQGTIQVDDAHVAAQKVDELRDKGVTFIKLVYDGREGVPRIRLSVASAIINESHRLGLRVFAHVTSPVEARDMMNAGVDGIEHDFKDMPLLAGEMAKKRVIFTPTLQAFRTFLPQFVPGLIRDMKAAYEAGVNVAVGTDFPNGPGGQCGDDYFDELAMLEQSGASRAQVLHSATAVGALKAGQESEIGRVDAGYRANLVFFDGDLEQGAVTKDRIRKVMFHGAMIVENGAATPSKRELFSAHSFLFAPYAYYDPLNSFVLGASLTDFDLLQTGALTSLTMGLSINARAAANLNVVLPSPIPGTFLTANLSFDNFRRMYYGIGNGSSLSEATPYDPTLLAEVVRARTRLVGPLSVNSSLSFKQEWDGVSPASAGSNETLLGVSLALDTRDCSTNPWYGTYLALGGDVSSAYLGSANDFARATADARMYVSPIPHFILALRLMAIQATGGTPAEYLPSLGGAEIGRGFPPARFCDQLLVASQLELRFPIAWILQGALFADVGEVSRDWEALRLDGLHDSYGLGIRMMPSPDESWVMSLDAGFSREGWNLSFRYGQAF